MFTCLCELIESFLVSSELMTLRTTQNFEGGSQVSQIGFQLVYINNVCMVTLTTVLVRNEILLFTLSAALAVFKVLCAELVHAPSLYSFKKRLNFFNFLSLFNC